MVTSGGGTPRFAHHEPGVHVNNKTKTIAIAAVASLAVLATLGEAGSSGDGEASAPAQSAAADESAASEEAAPAASSWYTETYGTFETLTKKGKGDGIIKLPADAEVGVVTAVHKGSANFSLSVLDETNQPTGDLLVNTIGNYKGTTAYGFSALGNPGVKIQVTADGSWSVKVAPVSSAPTLTIPAKGTGDKVFLYDGGAADWNVVHKGKSNFALIQYSSDIMPNLAVNEIGNYKGQVPMSAGPSVVDISADGAWSFSE